MRLLRDKFLIIKKGQSILNIAVLYGLDMHCFHTLIDEQNLVPDIHFVLVFSSMSYPSHHVHHNGAVIYLESKSKEFINKFKN